MAGKTVALLVGGWSVEREVSLEKGKAVFAALRSAGYDVRVVDVKRDLDALVQALTPKPDVVFNNLYGRGGEDGTIQSLLEILQIPYTHSGVMASSIGMNKDITKRLAASVGVKSAEGVVAGKDDVLAERVMKRPYVVKPVSEGSSVGVRIVMENDNHLPLDASDWDYGDDVLVERYIAGRELTVAVLDGKAQAVTDIVSDARFFDYDAKYKDDKTRYVLPADLPQDVYQAALKKSEDVYRLLGCSGLARCDYRYDETHGGADGLYFLEINTQPGLTAESIAPAQLAYNGMNFEALCAHLVETAKCHDDSSGAVRESEALESLKAMVEGGS